MRRGKLLRQSAELTRTAMMSASLTPTALCVARRFAALP